MTDFKVTDDAVEAAINAWCDVAEVDEWRVRNTRESLLAAIEAALPVMFETAGWQMRDRFWNGAPWSEWATFNRESACDNQIAVLEDWLTEKRVVFAIKEPK